MNTTQISRRVLCIALLLGATPLACNAEAANVSAERACDVHAAAMVAEMKASSSTALSAAEIALVRRTAFKSCITRGEPTTESAVPVDDATVASSDDSAPDASAPDSSLWGSFERLLKQPVERTPGHDRLRKRSGGH